MVPGFKDGQSPSEASLRNACEKGTPKNRATCESCRVTRAAFSQSFHGHLLPQAADLIPRIYAMGRSSICQSIDCNLRGHFLSTRSARKQNHPAHCPLQAMASRHLEYRLRCTSSSSSSQERLRSFPTQSNPPSNPKYNSFLEGSHRLKVLGTAARSIPTATEEILQLGAFREDLSSIPHCLSGGPVMLRAALSVYRLRL